MCDGRVLQTPGKLNLEHEIISNFCENEERTEHEYSVQTVAECAKILIQENRYEDFGRMLEWHNEEQFRMLMENETFLTMYLKYKMHLQHYEEIFQILQTVRNTYKPIFLQLWDEAHYQHHLATHGRLTSVHKFRIRQRHPPPPGIFPNGVRPLVRLLGSATAVLREWFDAHSTDPYPCKKAKQALAKRAGIPVAKVTAWFSNARRQLKKKLKKGESLKAVTDKCANGKENVKSDKCMVTDQLVKTATVEYDAAMVQQGGNMEHRDYKGRKLEENKKLVDMGIVSAENTRPSLFSFDNENVIPAVSYNWPATVQTVYKLGGSTDASAYNAMVKTIDQRVPFSQVQMVENGHYKISKPYSENHFGNVHYYTDEKTGYHNFFKKLSDMEYKATTKAKVSTEGEAVTGVKADTMTGNMQEGFKVNRAEVMVGHDANIVTENKAEITGNKAKVMTETKTKAISRNNIKFMEENTTDKYSTKSANSLHKKNRVKLIDVCKLRPVQPKLKVEEMHSETKVQNIKSIWKLRLKVKERQMKRRELKRGKEMFEEHTANDSLRSLQKLCDNIEINVESPKDFACSVEITESLNDSNGDILWDGDSFSVNNAKLASIANATAWKMDAENRRICTEMMEKKCELQKVVGRWNVMHEEEQGWYKRANTRQEYPQNMTGVDLSTDCRCAGSTESYLHEDNLVPSPPATYNCHTICPDRQHTRQDYLVPSPPATYTCHTSWPDRQQHTRSTDTHFTETWQPCYSPDIQEVTSWFMEAPSREDYHGFTRNSGSYDTVVGEAIQGLLNLSSSQESECSCVE